MFKKIKMIVITKKMIFSALAIFIAGALGVISLNFFLNRRDLAVFADYKPIIDSQITGIGAKKAEKMLSFKNVYKNIIKSFFILKEVEIEYSCINDEEDLTENVEEAEVKRIIKGLELSNNTDFQIDPNDFADKKLSFSLDEQGPQILIIHTHTTESYNNVYNSSDRDLDESKNVVAVGDTMAEIFEKNGIPVYHDKTVHDYPSYNGAYQRAAITIRNDLEAYPSIKVVLDIHRDGITKEDGTKVKLLTSIDGKDTAQAMLVVGTNTNLTHENWQENFKFAVKIQAKAIEMYPTLMRQINLRKERFNEQMTTGSLIIEIGTNGNTLPEALESGKDVAEVISAVLKESD